MSINLHVTSKIISRIGENLCEHGLGSDFLDLTSQSIKEHTDKLNFVKNGNVCSSEGEQENKPQTGKKQF